MARGARSARLVVSLSSLFVLTAVAADVEAEPMITIQTGYELVDLQTPSGRESFCMAISPSGAVAGADKVPGSNDSRAATWTPGGVEQIVAGAGSQSVAVGFAGAEPVGYGVQALMPGGFKGSQVFPNAMALGVGPQGEMVGIKGNDKGGTDAYVFNPSHTLKAAAGFPVGGAYDVNSAGTIVGYVATATAQGSPTKAVRWTKDGGAPVILPGRGAQTGGSAYAINDKGVIIGYVGSSDASTAAKWEGDQLTELGTLGGASGATGINSGGTIIGWSNDAAGHVHGVLFRGGKVIDLNTMIHRPSLEGLTTLARANVVANEWLLQAAGGINDKGEICGWAARKGEYHAVILRPTTRTMSVATLEEIAKAFETTKPAQRIHLKRALTLR